MTALEIPHSQKVVRDFLAALPVHARRMLTLDPQLVAAIVKACDSDEWTPQSLAAYVGQETHRHQHYDPSGLMAWRINRAAHPEPTPTED